MTPRARGALLAACAAWVAASGLAAQDLPRDSVGPARRLVPAFASGLPWVMPLPVTPRELAARLTGRSPAEIQDSIIDALGQRYLDAVAAEQARAPSAPSWTTTLGEQAVGLDARWIYLGPVRVPTFLLALLPLNLEGNPIARDQWRRRASMLEDIAVAGRRAATLDELEASIRQVRERREEADELVRNQRIPPPDGTEPR